MNIMMNLCIRPLTSRRLRLKLGRLLIGLTFQFRLTLMPRFVLLWVNQLLLLLPVAPKAVLPVAQAVPEVQQAVLPLVVPVVVL
jgi:hypothetical protein